MERSDSLVEEEVTKVQCDTDGEKTVVAFDGKLAPFAFSLSSASRAASRAALPGVADGKTALCVGESRAVLAVQRGVTLSRISSELLREDERVGASTMFSGGATLRRGRPFKGPLAGYRGGT
ncbi:unnamed protein product [Chondrus crispus]|uniref:Uncharacterized protein n=1 Tax=Chondrus crispus TaxID=2769 RepID=R7QPV6_CHOCR|nr:unnamed protein product [Chondrus crispus]CDF40507.1 unnamed protein product [Chondrus crispus]|eukprot:XP_005710801.1 unnamed protein product [Chondrus crispus]